MKSVHKPYQFAIKKILNFVVVEFMCSFVGGLEIINRLINLTVNVLYKY